jgi:hypothetical protein
MKTALSVDEVMGSEIGLAFCACPSFKVRALELFVRISVGTTYRRHRKIHAVHVTNLIRNYGRCQLF